MQMLLWTLIEWLFIHIHLIAILFNPFIPDVIVQSSWKVLLKFKIGN